MGLADRDYMKTGYDKSEHPPACTCVNCTKRRLNTQKQEYQYISKNNNKKIIKVLSLISIIIGTIFIIIGFITTNTWEIILNWIGVNG